MGLILSLKKHAKKSMCKVSTDLAQIHTLAAIPKLNPSLATFFVQVHFMTFNPKFTYKIGLCRSGKVGLEWWLLQISDPSCSSSPLENGIPFYMLDMLHGEHGGMRHFFFTYVPRQSVKA